MFQRFLGIVAMTALAFQIASGPTMALADALARLKPQRLADIHAAIADLQLVWTKTDRPPPYRDYRANLHVHSLWSHDSRGTRDEIVAAARKAGTQILMFSEHPADHYDFFAQGHHGTQDGVLMIPGAESQGFLVYPTHSLHGNVNGTPQQFSDLVRGRGGQMFVSHLEERMDWAIRGVTGVEIYNTHADFKDEKAMIAALRNPLWIFQVAEAIRMYPQEAYSAIQDYPQDYLARWDELCKQTPHTGVSANDAHQNVGLIVRWSAPEKVRVEDALGKLLLEVDRVDLPGHEQLCREKQVGDLLFRFLLDPYEVSLRHVGTHLLLHSLNEANVREALDRGRAYVAFDWLADASGFDFAAVAGNRRAEMGEDLAFEPGMRLQAQSPLPVLWKIIRDGALVCEMNGRRLEWEIAEQGNYRVEAWLDVAGERLLWVLANPIYVRSEK